jgi:hypothetical protein
VVRGSSGYPRAAEHIHIADRLTGLDALARARRTPSVAVCPVSAVGAGFPGVVGPS